MLTMTKHGEARCNSRGIKAKDLIAIMESGSAIGDCECWVSDKNKTRKIAQFKQQIKFLEQNRPEGWAAGISELKRQIQRFDKLAGKMVIANDNRVISAYHLNPKRRKWRTRRGQRNGYC